MGSYVHWLGEPPSRRQPVLLVALEGFVDAGSAAATAAMFLRHRWRAEPLARFDRDAFLDYRARRPAAAVDGGKLLRIDWPDLELHAAEVGGPHDAYLLVGPEPDMRWESFAEVAVETCRRLGVEFVLGLGAYPAAAPHSRPIRVMRVTNAAAGDLVPQASDVAGYAGPVGAGTVLQHALGQAGIPAAGLWAEVPHYIAGSPNPRAALALVLLVAATLQTQVDTTELEAAAKLHDEQVAEAVADHAEAREMIAALELAYDQGGAEEDLPSGDDIAREIERYLRQQ